MLTPREFQIAYRILSANAGLRIKALADEFQVSSRSIQYSLDNVRDFLKKRNILYCSSSSKGIWAECSAAERSAALEELSLMQRENIYFDQEQRISRIFLQLIFLGGNVTAVSLAESLKVSRSTILNDMNHAEILLKDSGLILRRQVRWGYRLDGPELALRTLAENSLQEGLSVYDVYLIINSLKSGVQDINSLPFPQEVLRDYMDAGQQLFRAFSEQAAQIQRENVIGLLIRLLLSVARVRNGYFVGDSEEPADVSSHYLYPYWAAVYLKNGLPVLKDELDYIQGWYQEKKSPVDITDFSMKLVEEVSRLEKFPYYEDNTLYSRLLIHLRHCFSSENNIMAKNPFHEMVISNHSHLYNSIQMVCREYIESAYIFAAESFVSYLALHFLVSHQNLGVVRKLRVAFVCATGQGGARIIARMLEAEIRQIEVISLCSLTEVDDVVRNMEPDFMISVFPVETDVPVVVVEPLPTKADIEAIQSIVNDKLGSDQLLYINQSANMFLSSENQEDISQDVILTGLKIYASLLEEKSWVVKPELEFAFLTHVMLLANRYMFNKQFYNQSVLESAFDIRIKSRLEEIGIVLTLDEVKALTYYLTACK